LYISWRKNDFNEHNCRNCPFMGQKEVGFTYFKDDQSAWEITDVNKDIFNKLKRYLLYIIKNYLITY